MNNVKQYYKNYIKMQQLKESGQDPSFSDEFKQNTENIPAKLYKYHKVDNHTLDAIRNKFLYIAPADKMDDQFELALSIPYEKLKNSPEELEREYVLLLFERFSKINPALEKKLKPMTDNVKNLGIKKTNQYINVRISKDPELRAIKKEFNTRLKESDFYENTEKLFEALYNLRSRIGFYSMTEEKYSQVMWTMYGDNYNGILIEYDINASPNGLKNDIIQVKYDNKRDTDPIMMYINLLGKVIEDNGDINPSKNAFQQWLLDVVGIKNKEWEFQKEWRVISDSQSCYRSPKISAIYLGKYLCNADRNEVIDLCHEMKIEVYEQYDNFEKMAIEYREMDNSKERNKAN